MEYTPPSDGKEVMYTLQLVQEYRNIIRQMFQFGKGGVGRRAPLEEQNNDKTFEMDLLKMIVSSTPPDGDGTLGAVAANMQYLGSVNTVVTSNQGKEVLGGPEVMWSMFVVSHLGTMTAASISYLTIQAGSSQGGRGGGNSLRYHTNSGSALTSLQRTACKESTTMCGLVLYLAQRLCMKRIDDIMKSNCIAVSKECSECNAGAQCALTWSNSFTHNISMGSSLTDASKRAKMGAGADTYNNVFITEYNNTGGLIGNAGQDRVKAADGFNAAHQKTYGLYKDSLSNTSNKSANEAVPGMFKEIKSVSDYVISGSHGV